MSRRHCHRVVLLLAGCLAWLSGAAPEAVTLPAQRAARGTASQGEANRDAWQRVPDIFAAMGVKDGAVVADVGAGNGYFTTRLARAVGPTGRVYAVDISTNALNSLRQRVQREGLTNVEAILGITTDPKLPDGVLDAALIVNAYHEMTEHQAMLAAIKRALKPSGRLVIVEPSRPDWRGAPRSSQERDHQISPQYVQQDALAAGFVIVRVDDPFTSRGTQMHEFLVALTPSPEPTAAPPAHAHADGMSEQQRRPDEVVAAIGLKPGQTVVDLGAGSGIFTRRFAAVVGPSGHAIALDIDPSRVEAIKADAVRLGLRQYEARVVAPDNPEIPAASADVIFLSNTYHHIENRVAYFSRLRGSLKPGGRLVIVDFAPGAVGGGAVDGHPDQKQVEAELVSAGYRLTKTHSFLANQFFLEFVVGR
jgi:ubiquinone/menaquinone biosynthesis C-methylase UbiE